MSVNPTGVSDFMRDKLEREAKKNWDLFYKRNGNRFFKDRHWTLREFQELEDDSGAVTGELGEQKILLEVGCGVGNFIFPLLEENIPLYVYGCDFSPVAIDLCQSNPANNPSKCSFFVSDLTSDKFVNDFRTSAQVNHHSNVHVISLIFVLSAISPDKFTQCISNLFSVLAPGGIVLFRDYADGDHAMKRFDPKQQISDKFFVRQDGTRAYYFDKETLQEMFERQGFQTIAMSDVNRTTTNVKENISVDRTFIQAKFRKIIN